MLIGIKVLFRQNTKKNLFSDRLNIMISEGSHFVEDFLNIENKFKKKLNLMQSK